MNNNDSVSLLASQSHAAAKSVSSAPLSPYSSVELAIKRTSHSKRWWHWLNYSVNYFSFSKILAPLPVFLTIPKWHLEILTCFFLLGKCLFLPDPNTTDTLLITKYQGPQSEHHWRLITLRIRVSFSGFENGANSMRGGGGTEMGLIVIAHKELWFDYLEVYFYFLHCLGIFKESRAE